MCPVLGKFGILGSQRISKMRRNGRKGSVPLIGRENIGRDIYIFFLWGNYLEGRDSNENNYIFFFFSWEVTKIKKEENIFYKYITIISL